MKVSPLSILRYAQPGSPKLRQIAKRLGCSATALNMFEMGRYELGAALRGKYAKMLGVTRTELRRRFLMSALAYHEAESRTARAELKRLGYKTVQGRRRAVS